MTIIPPSSLATKLRHVQTLSLDRADDTQLSLLVQGLPYHLGGTVQDPSRACTSLKYLYIDWLKNPELLSRPLVTLLEYNPHLTRLDVPYDIFEVDGASAALSKLWHLQCLSIHGEGTVLRPFLFLQSCLCLPELTELTFHRDMEMYWDHGDETTVVRKLEAIINDALIARLSFGPTAKRIKSLQLPVNLTGIKNPLPLLLLKSKLLDLETCEIPWFREDAAVHEVQQVVREHCHNLKHLRFPQLYEEEQDSQAARAFIRGCSGLQSFTSTYFMDGLDYAPRHILSELVKYHHTTLEVLELTDSYQLFSRDLQEVLSQCKRLKRFWVMDLEQDDSMSGIAFSDITRSDWVCTELRVFGVALNRRCYPNELWYEEQGHESNTWPRQRMTRRVYQQIGQLKNLEVLAIGIDRSSRATGRVQDYMWDLTLRKGWLGEWAGLKNLRSLRLQAGLWTHMNQEDVEFMHEHWPLLDEIIVTRNISDLQTKQHWQWLLEKRPYLRLKEDGWLDYKSFSS
ncbi:hypothetical protein BGZ70_006003 [Mortierella alpina]|uniref:Uncharacterized protein n=1 Tax=Mortierella alpina TaxID=64518 RepID=A0A9P6M410_MORAP|nr:hypothetical protein BGZ70_006003 [Mortierella alpina]